MRTAHQALRAAGRALMTTFLGLALLLIASPASAWVPLYQCNAAWPDEDLPLTWYLNNRGSDNFQNIADLERVLVDSFTSWETPCCSKFRASYGGQTSASDATNAQPVVLTFLESNWPAQLGDIRSTLGVTRTGVLSNCTIYSAPIFFNGDFNNWTTNCQESSCPFDRTYTDQNGNRFVKNYVHLQAVATHEIGHLLGLNHTNIRDATMFAAYQDGSGGASLHSDDIEGVCALYPRQCTCTDSQQCTGARERCVDGRCTEEPCANSTECDPGLECDNGECVEPPCATDNECGPGFFCDQPSGDCKPECAVCAPCEENQECGGNGVCIDFGTGDKKCIVPCDQQGLCPGDAECNGIRRQDGSVSWICTNPGLQSLNNLCRNYVCMNEQLTNPCDNCTPNQMCVENRCVDMMTDPDMGTMDEDPMNPDDDMGNNNGDMGNNNTSDMGGGSTNDPDNEGRDQIIVINDGPGQNNVDESSCASLGPQQRPQDQHSLLLTAIALFGALLLRRRRQLR